MNYTLEQLDEHTLPDMAALGYAFVNEVNHPGGFSYPDFAKHWGPTLAYGIGEIFAIRSHDKVVAILGCAFVPECFSGWLTACEQFWYVSPEHRNAGLASKLFDAFEAEAVRRGCKKIIMAHLETPEAEKLHALYLKRGYRPVEKTFGKEI